MISVSILVIFIGSLHVFMSKYFNHSSKNQQDLVNKDPHVSNLKHLDDTLSNFLHSVLLIIETSNSFRKFK
jgi:hypothetical protein